MNFHDFAIGKNMDFYLFPKPGLAFALFGFDKQEILFKLEGHKYLTPVYFKWF